MVSITKCDRCGFVFEPYAVDATYYSLGDCQHDSPISRTVDLCMSCHALLQKFMDRKPKAARSLAWTPERRAAQSARLKSKGIARKPTTTKKAIKEVVHREPNGEPVKRRGRPPRDPSLPKPSPAPRVWPSSMVNTESDAERMRKWEEETIKIRVEPADPDDFD